MMPVPLSPGRFTPTCVGTIRNMGIQPDSGSVHPHVRGDNICLACGTLARFGSPPRAWGQWRAGDSAQRVKRFTPTCVGTMGGAWEEDGLLQVHPHVRGDNVRVSLAINSVLGSPPRAWGQYSAPRFLESQIRFTPTCVGTISPCFISASGRSVHPHVRGDNPTTRRHLASNSGSPPRAWGQSHNAKAFSQ